MCIPDEKVGLLPKNKIFSNLRETELAEISAASDTLSFEAGETVFSFGDKSQCMYIVISGELTVFKPVAYENSREIAKLITGDSLGELGMITGDFHSVTAICDTPSVLFRFPAEGRNFRDFLEEYPGTGSRILFSFINDIADRTRRANALLKENSPHIQELRRQIYQDKLTGLFNKTWLDENLPLELKKEQGEASLLMMKPDNFKLVNDTAGHEAGDNLLVHIARLIPAVLPRGIQVVRYLGNEFALLYPGMGRTEARELAEGIREFYNTLDISRFVPNASFSLSVSIGIATYPSNAVDAESLIEKAHRLPLEGRSRGGNMILFPEDCAGEALC